MINGTCEVTHEPGRLVLTLAMDVHPRAQQHDTLESAIRTQMARTGDSYYAALDRVLVVPAEESELTAEEQVRRDCARGSK